MENYSDNNALSAFHTASASDTEQNEIVRQNIQSLRELQAQTDAAQTRQERISDRITRFTGSLTFVYCHVIWFGSWILLNLGIIHIPHLTDFDPYPFGLLTLTVSLEAIFLSAFLLISQNREAKISQKRTELDLQINLLSEQKAAKVIDLLYQVIKQLNKMDNSFNVPLDRETVVLKSSPSAETVLREIEDSNGDDSKR